jgi:hypothetical protein
MLLLVALCLSAVPSALVPAQDEARETFDLRFRPAEGRQLVVSYTRDLVWNHSRAMRGTLHTELELVWKFGQGEKGPEAKAEFASVVYRGEGVKNSADWKYDVLWNREEGYLKGKGGKAARTWIDKELKEGVKFVLDQRGAVQPGGC